MASEPTTACRPAIRGLSIAPSGSEVGFPRVSAARSLKQFQNKQRFQVLVGGSRAKTILAMNHQRKPLNDVRVRRAIAAAIDRAAVIEGSADGFGVPIGSFQALQHQAANIYVRIEATRSSSY